MEINSKIAAATLAADIELTNSAQQATPIKEPKAVPQSKKAKESPELSEEQAKQECRVILSIKRY